MRSLPLVLQIATVALAATVEYNLNITNAVVSPDGFERTGVIVNGQYPGTLIQANKDDTVNLNVLNFLDDPTMRRSTSVHWHGFFQMRTGTEDGPAFINQCPIPPAPAEPHIYPYSFPLSGQAGTFWYHSHLASQYVDGLRGAFVVYDPDDPHKALYDVDDENTVIFLSDWYHLPSPGIAETYLSGEPDNGGHHEPIPDSGTINGRGRYVGGPEVPWSRIDVEQGKRYRLRIINGSGYGFFTFGIAGHRLTIIEVDGISHKPLTVDSFEIYEGQRYSVVVEANQDVDNYWIHAPIEMQHHSDNNKLDGNNVFAVLHYEGAPDADPTAEPESPGGIRLEEHLLVPLENPGAPGGENPDHIVDIDFTRDKDGDDRLIWTINDIAYKSPDLPTLLTILNGARTESDFSRDEHTIILQRNETVELRIHGSSNGHVHPFHLHGHAFDIVQSRTGPANYINPPRRDVVGVGSGGGEVRIQFRADNPGPWILHCHIDWHLEAGLAVVFAEDPEGIVDGPKSVHIPQAWRDLCPAYAALPAELQ